MYNFMLDACCSVCVVQVRPFCWKNLECRSFQVFPTRDMVAAGMMHAEHGRCGHDVFFFPSVSQFSTKITFPPDLPFFFPSPDPPLFFPISVYIALTKSPTYPSTLGTHTLNAAAYFMTYPKFLMLCGKKESGSGGNAPFMGKK